MYVTQNKLHQSNNAFQHTRNPVDEEGTKKVNKSIDSIVKGLETDLINTFPADSPRCAVDNIVDSFHGCF